MVILPENKKIGSFTDFKSEYSIANLDGKQIWQSYSNVYDLMYDIPFIKKLRKRHVAAMRECNVILDAGCGPGLITRDLALSKDKNVIGIDLSEDMLRQAAYRLKNFKNVELYRGDVLDLPFDDNTFDGYISNNVLHFIGNPNKFFSEIMRVLKQGGLLSISSARPCCNMELLIDVAHDYFLSNGVDEETLNKVKQMEDSNRALLKGVQSVYEPYEISRILRKEYGCQTIIYEGVAYLKQSFHVVAKK